MFFRGETPSSSRECGADWTDDIYTTDLHPSDALIKPNQTSQGVP